MDSPLSEQYSASDDNYSPLLKSKTPYCINYTPMRLYKINSDDNYSPLQSSNETCSTDITLTQFPSEPVLVENLYLKVLKILIPAAASLTIR